MIVDIIILSHGKTQPLIELTQRTVDSVHASEINIQFNVLVMEQTTGIVYANCKTHHITEPFNYNRFMNIGVGMTSNEYVCLCNNDLVFYPGWCKTIIAAMGRHKLLSACPKCPDSTYKAAIRPIALGYNNRHHMSGWCIVCNRDLFKTIGPIDEDFPFWFADNAYAEQLKKHKVQHALVTGSLVKHLGSTTLNDLEPDAHHSFTWGLVKKFIAKYPMNESARFFAQELRRKGEGV